MENKNAKLLRKIEKQLLFAYFTASKTPFSSPKSEIFSKFNRFVIIFAGYAAEKMIQNEEVWKFQKKLKNLATFADSKTQFCAAKKRKRCFYVILLEIKIRPQKKLLEKMAQLAFFR